MYLCLCIPLFSTVFCIFLCENIEYICYFHSYVFYIMVLYYPKRDIKINGPINIENK